MEDIVVRGVAADKNQVKITVAALADRPGVAAGLFKELARANINVDMIVQNVSAQGVTDLSFTVPRAELAKARKVLQALDHQQVDVNEDIAKVSIVGVGMKSHSGVAYRMFDALAKASINISMIATSEIKISVVIKKEQADKATQVLHKVFGLGKKAKK